MKRASEIFDAFKRCSNEDIYALFDVLGIQDRRPFRAASRMEYELALLGWAGAITIFEDQRCQQILDEIQGMTSGGEVVDYMEKLFYRTSSYDVETLYILLGILDRKPSGSRKDKERALTEWVMENPDSNFPRLKKQVSDRGWL